MSSPIADFALAHVGDGYIYGAGGQVCSPAFRQQQARQYPEWEENILRVGAKWDGRQVWDCAQLTRYAAKAAGHSLPSGATSQWNKGAWARKGSIASLPPGETVFLYRQGDGRMQHTGIAIGDGSCVHAKSTREGVVREQTARCGWSHWAALSQAPAKLEGEMSMDMIITAENGLPVNLRPAPSTRVGYLTKLPVGTAVKAVSYSEEDGEQWAYVAAGSRSGYVMAKFLKPAGDDAAQSQQQTVAFVLEKQLAQQLAAALAAALERG